jgi:hypothetical protein
LFGFRLVDEAGAYKNITKIEDGSSISDYLTFKFYTSSYSFNEQTKTYAEQPKEYESEVCNSAKFASLFDSLDKDIVQRANLGTFSCPRDLSNEFVKGRKIQDA